MRSGPRKERLTIMEFDYQGTSLTVNNGVVSFPDYPYVNVPKAPSQIKETVQLRGTIGRVIHITGSTNQKDSK